jgi:hypothetical protein
VSSTHEVKPRQEQHDQLLGSGHAGVLQGRSKAGKLSVGAGHRQRLTLTRNLERNSVSLQGRFRTLLAGSCDAWNRRALQQSCKGISIDRHKGPSRNNHLCQWRGYTSTTGHRTGNSTALRGIATQRASPTTIKTTTSPLVTLDLGEISRKIKFLNFFIFSSYFPLGKVELVEKTQHCRLEKRQKMFFHL